MNYNNSAILWRNARESFRAIGARFFIRAGHIIKQSSAGNEVVARFDNNESATKCLRDAGYQFDINTARFHPSIDPQESVAEVLDWTM